MKSIYNYQLTIFTCVILQLCLGSSISVFSQTKNENFYFDIKTPRDLREMFHYTGDSIPFLSCHRGGPEYHLPENCTATFENTLRHTYAIIEIDPRYTRDSVIIVHHDRTLQRTTTGNGKVADFNYHEIQGLKLKDLQGRETNYNIQTLAEMLEWARGKTILVLDKKDVPIEERIKMVEDHNAEAYTIMMAYTFEEAKIAHQLNKDIFLQVFINSPEKVQEFDKTGIPWGNIVAFVGHQMPDDPSVFNLVHQKGARCIIGTSRNLDKELIEGANIERITEQYLGIFQAGADILETDIPVPLSKIIANRLSSKSFISKHFQSQ